MYEQIIIMRSDLELSAGQILQYVTLASNAFLINTITRCVIAWNNQTMSPDNARIKNPDEICCYECNPVFPKDLYEQWISGKQNVAILKAKDKSHLLKSVTKAIQLGMQQDEDYFMIYDKINPTDAEDTLVGMGFKPMESSYINQIAKNYFPVR